jgi:hypothetical protein
MTSITCPRCGWTSHNPHDVAERYCGHCHVFLDDAVPMVAAVLGNDVGLSLRFLRQFDAEAELHAPDRLRADAERLRAALAKKGK